MKNPRPYVFFAFIGFLAVGGVVFYLSYDFKGSAPNLFENASTDAAAVITSSVPASGVDVAKVIADPVPPPEGYIKYENKRYGFSFYHSPEFVIKEYDEGGGAMTVTEENEKKMRGLQIFIVPYGGTTISEERFKKDVPSGVRVNVENTFIGPLGTRAVTFNSYDSFLGETRELWFIHNGYLYEVTTFKGMGDWFAPIMQTWRFL